MYYHQEEEEKYIKSRVHRDGDNLLYINSRTIECSMGKKGFDFPYKSEYIK